MSSCKSIRFILLLLILLLIYHDSVGPRSGITSSSVRGKSGLLKGICAKGAFLSIARSGILAVHAVY